MSIRHSLPNDLLAPYLRLTIVLRSPAGLRRKVVFLTPTRRMRLRSSKACRLNTSRRKTRKFFARGSINPDVEMRGLVYAAKARIRKGERQRREVSIRQELKNCETQLEQSEKSFQMAPSRKKKSQTEKGRR